MSLSIGLAMIFAAFLIGRIAKTGGRIQPPPFWNNDSLNGFIVVPGIVILLAAGIATNWGWAVDRGWREMGYGDAAWAAATVVAFLALWRVITAWQHGVLPLTKAA